MKVGLADGDLGTYVVDYSLYRCTPWQVGSGCGHLSVRNSLSVIIGIFER